MRDLFLHVAISTLLPTSWRWTETVESLVSASLSCIGGLKCILCQKQICGVFSGTSFRLVRATRAARKTAARWFNRLYYDVRKWNKGFIEFLHSYPGFSNSKSVAKYRTFDNQLKEYRESLEEHYGTVKGDLCTSLKVLSARYPNDFDWLFRQDKGLYYEVRQLIDDTYASEARVVGIAYGVCDFIYSLSDDPKWHKDNHEVIVARIGEYEKNPEVMVIGEVTMSQDNISIQNVIGPVNVKAQLEHVTQIVRNASAVQAEKKDQLSELLEQLKHALEGAVERQPEDSQRVIQAAEMVASEVSKEKPNKSFLGLSAEGLKEAAKAVSGIAPTVLSVAAQIAEFVGKLF